ncbi:MAG: hypothetical protein ACR5LF_03890 [Symbiopectobacterium sp.]
MAERLGISVATLLRLEKGEPAYLHRNTGTGAAYTLAQALLILGELAKINELLDTATDDIGLMMMNNSLPQRVHAKRITSGSGGLQVREAYSHVGKTASGSGRHRSISTPGGRIG